MSFRHTALIAASLWLPAAPALAATAPVADFESGQTLAIGLAGVSWDYGFTRAALGGYVGRMVQLVGPSDERIKIGTRGVWRIIDEDDIKVGPLAALEYDPGEAGGRSYLVPELGMGVAYRFVWNEAPLVVRFNVSLTVDQGQGRGPVPLAPNDLTGGVPTGNVFQRLVIGPNTMIGVGFAATEQYELTLGGGTLVGLRIHY